MNMNHDEQQEGRLERRDEVSVTIHLAQFLKTCGVPTGGQAKRLIQGGEVLVNGEVETRRRRQLRVGDEVTLDDQVFVVVLDQPTIPESADSTNTEQS